MRWGRWRVSGSDSAVLRESDECHNTPETHGQYPDSGTLPLHGADTDGFEGLVAFYHAVREAIPDLTVTVEAVTPRPGRRFPRPGQGRSLPPGRGGSREAR